MSGFSLSLLAARPPGDIAQAMQVADQLEHQGAFDACRRQLRATLAHVSDAHLAAELGLRVCALHQRDGALMTSRACYSDLLPLLQDVQAQALARYRAAALAIDAHLPEVGRYELVRLIGELPHTHGARRAFVMARQLSREQQGAGGEIDFLLGVISKIMGAREPGAFAAAASSVEGRALLAEAMVEVGRIRLCECAAPQAASRMLRRALVVAQATCWQDDAQMWSARAYLALGQHAAAIKCLRDLLDYEEKVYKTGQGPHMSPYYDDALLEIGNLFEAEGRLGEAEAAYAQLAQRAPASRLLDDAAYRGARLTARRQHSPAAMNQFLRQFPDSPHARAVRQAAGPGPSP